MGKSRISQNFDQSTNTRTKCSPFDFLVTWISFSIFDVVRSYPYAELFQYRNVVKKEGLAIEVIKGTVDHQMQKSCQKLYQVCCEKETFKAG